jgi:hypothetical protein
MRASRALFAVLRLRRVALLPVSLWLVSLRPVSRRPVSLRCNRSHSIQARGAMLR